MGHPVPPDNFACTYARARASSDYHFSEGVKDDGTRSLPLWPAIIQRIRGIREVARVTPSKILLLPFMRRLIVNTTLDFYSIIARSRFNLIDRAFAGCFAETVIKLIDPSIAGRCTDRQETRESKDTADSKIDSANVHLQVLGVYKSDAPFSSNEQPSYGFILELTYGV